MHVVCVRLYTAIQSVHNLEYPNDSLKSRMTVQSFKLNITEKKSHGFLKIK
jgi:hypothetical protein